MQQLTVAQAARFLDVSDDTVRRWISAGRLGDHRDASGRSAVDGLELARLAKERSAAPQDPTGVTSSARNRWVGLVTEVRSDPVMSQVEMQCGPHRVVSLMSTEAVQELGLEPGSIATASVKATHVVVDVPGEGR